MHGVLSGLLSAEQAEAHYALIDKHLMGPDGARLFDAPMAYRGGPQQLFQRAESAANFGREIGLMYMHAHLRYAESLAVLGRAEAFFAALERAHPIGLTELVRTAAPRQANCYYSSSDAAFADRYVAQQHYADINAGEVALEGGWRIYSSGAGIAVSLVLRSLLGLRGEAGELHIDPVIPQRFDGLSLRRHWLGHDFEIRYALGPQGHGVQRLVLNGQALEFGRAPNRYRLGAATLDQASFMSLLHPGLNMLEIICA
jgi:CRISPR-associated protein Csx3